MAAGPNESSQKPLMQAMFDNAVALLNQGNHKEAIEPLKNILKIAPDQPQILNIYALSLAELADFDAAEKMLDHAIARNPDFVDSWVNLGVVHQKRGNFEAAANAYNEFRKRNPSAAVGHLNFANVCQLLGNFEEAEAAYEQALGISPDNLAAWSNLARTQLHIGNWQKSVEASDKALSLSPGHTGALAIKSVALLELGQTEKATDLVDFDRFIEKRNFNAPDGYGDLESFNDALCAHCLNHPSLVYEPGDNTTMKGHQTGVLSHDVDMGPIGDLLKLIDDAVKDYKSTHPVDPSHPFLAQQPCQWIYDIWGTVLGAQGHQAPHIHRSGWLSGCYYPKIPDVINSKGDDKAGWIEFGRPQDYPNSKAEPTVRSYQPHEGLVVLFPSYFYHRTVPFVSDEKRISIAFDILPIA